MKILSGFKSGYKRIRKSRFFSFFTVLLVMILLSLGILAALGLYGVRTELCTIKTGKGQGAVQSLMGTGMNLDVIPLNNIVKNGSFESFNSYDSFHIEGIDESRVFFDGNDLNNGLKDIEGNRIRIVTIDEHGVMNVGAEARILSYTSADLRNPAEISDPNWYWSSDAIAKTVTFDGVLVALTDKGGLISDATSEDLSKRLDLKNDRFVDICVSKFGVFAVSEKGKVYSSADAKNFNFKASLSDNADYNNKVNKKSLYARQIACVGNEVMILMNDGNCLHMQGTGFETVSGMNGCAHIRSTSNMIWCFKEDGSVYCSLNGLVFRREEALDDVLGGRKILLVKSCGDAAGILLEGGSIVVTGEDMQSFVIEGKTETTDICMISRDEILLLSPKGEISLRKGEETMIIGDGLTYDRIFAGEDKKLFCIKDNNLYETSILSCITLDSAITEGTVFPGDICYVERSNSVSSVSQFDEDDWMLSDIQGGWDVYGEGTMVSAIAEAPSGYGKKCARIVGTRDGLHVLSQKIADRGDQIFSSSDFMRIELRLMQHEISAGTVKVWISSEGCKDTGFVIEDCTGSFAGYTNVFVPSESLVKSKNEVRLNIGFEGSGELLADGVYLGLDRYSAVGMPSDYTELVTSAHPNYIRLNNLRIGAAGVSYDALFSLSVNSNTLFTDSGAVNNCASLEDSLRLVKDSQACPWLVIGSSASQSAVNALLEYIAGPMSSNFGKIRVDNGTAVPWSRQFTRFVIEINDSDGIFMSDVQRSAYVNYVMNIIRSSDRYVDIRDKIVFADGMEYDGGMMLSGADCHTTSHRCDGKLGKDQTFIEAMNEEYSSINTKTPRISSYGKASGEFIASFDMLSPFGSRRITAADCVTSFLTDQSVFTGIVLTDVDPGDTESEGSGTMLRSIKILEPLMNSSRFQAEVLKPLNDDSPYDLETFEKNVGVYSFQSEFSMIYVIANVSGEQQQFMIDRGGMSFDNAEMTKYDDQGKVIQTQKMPDRDRRYTLQPGQVMTVTIALVADE